MWQFVTPYTSYITAECHQYRWLHVTFFGATKIQMEMVTNIKSSKWNWLYRQIKRSLVVRLDVNRHMTHIDDSSLWIILWVAIIVNLETLLKNKMNLETRLLCLIHKSTSLLAWKYRNYLGKFTSNLETTLLTWKYPD